MKNLMIYLAIATMLFACKKEQLDYQLDEAFGKKGGNAGGGSLVSTDAVSFILPFGATSGGSVVSGGGGNNVTDRGVCYSLTPNPTIADATVPSGSGSGAFTCILSGLNGNTTYYTRAYATTVKQIKNKPPQTTTEYGNEEYFTTADPNFGTMTDNDGNTYNTIQIGTQVWMMENLKTTTYRNGISIPNVTDDVQWAGLSSGAYCNYDNSTANGTTYGRLYNWYAVDDPQNIAPAGWHVPTISEMQILVNYLGGSNVAGGRLKEAGTAHWNPHTGDNSSGYTALPGGKRYVSSSTPGTLYTGKNSRGDWWTASAITGGAQFIYLQSSTERVMGSIGGYTVFGGETSPMDKRMGYSVRLIKD